ncbi:MAG: NYN domain-containing protein [Candidatus Brocadiales bacterium]|nr:NYN domain-containing protein [Candidatus Brocadiales bacterium]
MNTTVYIDGFNLYYGSLKNTPFKWLDLNELCRLLLPKHQINKIKYFTAFVKSRPNDLNMPIRQQMYLRALRTLPNIEIIAGHFLTQEVNMPVAGCNPKSQRYVKVIKTEEKGSDVNLATHLLSDGYKGKIDVAVLITNDSDLVGPVKIVRNELKLAVGVINPHKKPSRILIQQASFVKQIRKGVLSKSQFPRTLKDSKGTFHKPSKW